MRPPAVALVTGAFSPEISSGGQQSRDVARALADRFEFHVVTTAVDPSLPAEAQVDAVSVHRIHIDVRSRRSRLRATWRLASVLVSLRRRGVRLVHLHGISSKNIVVGWCARWLGLKVVVTLHTSGQDEPAAVRARSQAEYRSLVAADRVMSISPHLSQRYLEAGLDPRRLVKAFNGVDTARFRPAGEDERAALRRELGLPDGPMVLFVGFFGPDKRPDVLLEAWSLVRATGRYASLVFVGATSSLYFEVDGGLATKMASRAEQLGLTAGLRFVAPTPDVDRYFRAATIYALPSVREAMPMALLEAMSCGLPCVASRLPGATDVMIEDGRNGRLVTPDAPADLAAVISGWLDDPAAGLAVGRAARETVESRYAISRAAEVWSEVYRQVLEA